MTDLIKSFKVRDTLLDDRSWRKNEIGVLGVVSFDEKIALICDFFHVGCS